MIDILPSVRSNASFYADYPFLDSLKDENPDYCKDIASIKKIIPCIFINKNTASSFFAGNTQFPQIIPLTGDIENNESFIFQY